MNIKKKNIMEESTDEVIIEAPTVETTPIIGIIDINLDKKLNIRKSPSTTADVLTTVKNGTKCYILDSNNDAFFKVELDNGIVGFAMKNYIKLI